MIRWCTVRSCHGRCVWERMEVGPLRPTSSSVESLLFVEKSAGGGRFSVALCFSTLQCVCTSFCGPACDLKSGSRLDACAKMGTLDLATVILWSFRRSSSLRARMAQSLNTYVRI